MSPPRVPCIMLSPQWALLPAGWTSTMSLKGSCATYLATTPSMLWVRTNVWIAGAG